MLRDHLCIEEKCRKGIENNKEFIEENREDIKNLEEDDKNGIQRYPNDNKSIIEETYLTNFLYELKNIRAKYSIGENISVIEEDFHNAIYDLEHIGSGKVGYLNLLWMVSLGILIETDKRNIERLGRLVEKENIQDFLIDYLLCTCDIGWSKITSIFYKENPYSITKEIIELAQKDTREASQRMQTYMEKEWFKSHYDYEWKNAHNEPGYVGFWSFDTAALAKILKLDDSNLIENNHYPYELAHYKNAMNFKPISINDLIQGNDAEEIDVEKEGIENNPLLEKMIPVRWHSFVNEMIYDYKVMDDRDFYAKYKELMGIDRIWFLLQEYEAENKEKNLLGSLIVFALTDKGYILQLDYKNDIEEYYSGLQNYWKGLKTKLVQFVLDNDQQYFAMVPIDTKMDKMYEVTILDVEWIKDT